MVEKNIQGISLGSKGENNIQILSGKWMLACDPDNQGKEQRWFERDGVDEAQEAPVPGVIQQVFPEYHGVVWYWHSFFPQIRLSIGNRYRLKFEFVDYYAEVWLNGVLLGSHEGSEMPFEFDATDSLNVDQENMLAIRLINPTDIPIDGLILVETAHRNKLPRGAIPGSAFNYGGIYIPVQLVSVPQVWISDVFVKPNIITGEIRAILSVNNESAINLEGRASLRVSLRGSELQLVSSAKACVFLHGVTEHEVSVTVTKPQLWNLDSPTLYRVNLTIDARLYDSEISHDYSLHCGFRDFRVEKGYFRLNGKRIFVRSTHTGNHYPIGIQVPENPYLYHQDLIYAKASGFNMVRFISGVPFRGQLDFCDEIGLLVYDECYASWCLGDSPKMKERFSGSTLDMVKRDRNHPCVVILGLLNETFDGPVFRHASSLLPEIRAIDDTRLVLLSSGRWDRQLDTGSLSNPGSLEWQFEWGAEAPGEPEIPYVFPLPWWDVGYPAGLYEKVGDVHVYPLEPRKEDINHLIRTIGKGTKPVFISEIGVGSLIDTIRLTRQFEQSNVRMDLPDSGLFLSIANMLEADWERLGMDSVYTFPEDMVTDSQRLHGRQRVYIFDLIRSNPQYCGYNLTGMLDHGFCGEGLWTFFREWKPGIMDVLQDGWAPLRWCLFVEPMHVYSGRAFKLEAVLANEDVLPSGQYPVCFRISGPKGIVWEKHTVLHIAEPAAGEEGYLAVPVLEEEIILDADSGEYVFSARMERGGAPFGGRMTFHMTKPIALPRVEAAVTLLGVPHEVEQWLSSQGVDFHIYVEDFPAHCELILVGDLSQDETTIAKWKSLMNKAASGSTVIFLSPHAFKRGEESMGWFPFASKGRSYKFGDFLYHKECVAKAHPFFDGLQPKGIMDSDYYGQMIPLIVFEGQDTPDEVIAAFFAIGYPIKSGYASGVLIGAYKFGDGRIVINTLPIMENLSLNPTADRFLLNMIASERQITENRPTDQRGLYSYE